MTSCGSTTRFRIFALGRRGASNGEATTEALVERYPELAPHTLEQVIDHYDRGGDVKDNLDANMKPLGLHALEKEDLLEFLRSLTGAAPQITVPALPQ